MQVEPIPAFADNYIWLLQSGGRAVVVDPGDAGPVLRTLADRGLALAAVLITHHHGDHIGGLPALLARHAAPVYGPGAEARTIGRLDHVLADGDAVQLPDFGGRYEVMAMAGHTLGHISYCAQGFLFCGDTLFSAGCGRLFEGTPEQMYLSLTRLAALPGETGVYCAHEYTVANLRFALAVEPGNQAAQQYFEHAQALRRAGQPTLPSTIARERAVNPFLRCAEPAVIAAALANGAASERPVDVFAALRRWKDGFRTA